MYYKIRITVVSLALIVLCMLSSVGTLSYFTDSVSIQNDFAIGNASTELAIYKDTNSTPFDTANLSPLTDGMQDVAYYLQATNNGNIPVYQRFRVVVPIELADVLTLKMDDCTLVVDEDDADISRCDNANYSVTYNKSVDVDNSPTYAEYYILSKNILGVGEKTSEWPTTAIAVGKISSVEDFRQIATCKNDNANKCSFGVRAYSDAIQTTGFANAIQAFENLAETY